MLAADQHLEDWRRKDWLRLLVTGINTPCLWSTCPSMVDISSVKPVLAEECEVWFFLYFSFFFSHSGLKVQ